MTSAKKIVVEFILPNVETSVVSGSTTNESFQLSAQLRLRSNLLRIDSAAQLLKLLSYHSTNLPLFISSSKSVRCILVSYKQQLSITDCAESHFHSRAYAEIRVGPIHLHV